MLDPRYQPSPKREPHHRSDHYALGRTERLLDLSTGIDATRLPAQQADKRRRRMTRPPGTATIARTGELLRLDRAWLFGANVYGQETTWLQIVTVRKGNGTLRLNAPLLCSR